MSHGSQQTILAPISKNHLGTFGRMAGHLDVWVPKDASGQPMKAKEVEQMLIDFANEHMIENEPVPDSSIPAGYTYLGQFIDHDITHDPTPLGTRKRDPEKIHNSRTPALDLDSVYGAGPDESPFMYSADGSFIIGQVSGTPFADLPRASNGKAIIGDKRNDENAIVAQVHLAFMLAHNRILKHAGSFDHARRTLIKLYQSIVWNDFIERLCHDQIKNAALIPTTDKMGISHWKLGLKHIYNWTNSPFIPVEFSVAAYRFGHSMVRNGYRTNINQGFTLADEVKLFDPAGNDLRGFGPLRAENVIQWDWFLDMASSKGFPQRAKKINTTLSRSLANLMDEARNPLAPPQNLLAYRNLQRSWMYDLPSGTAMAEWIVPPNMHIEITPDEPDSLWYYILKEAGSAQGKHGEQFGRLGSTIICAVFAGLLKGDKKSYFNTEPTWKPQNDPLLKAAMEDAAPDHTESDWNFDAIIRLAGLPISAADFPRGTS